MDIVKVNEEAQLSSSIDRLEGSLADIDFVQGQQLRFLVLWRDKAIQGLRELYRVELDDIICPSRKRIGPGVPEVLFECSLFLRQQQRVIPLGRDQISTYSSLACYFPEELQRLSAYLDSEARGAVITVYALRAVFQELGIEIKQVDWPFLATTVLVPMGEKRVFVRTNSLFSPSLPPYKLLERSAECERVDWHDVLGHWLIAELEPSLASSNLQVLPAELFELAVPDISIPAPEGLSMLSAKSHQAVFVFLLTARFDYYYEQEGLRDLPSLIEKLSEDIKDYYLGNKEFFVPLLEHVMRVESPVTAKELGLLLMLHVPERGVGHLESLLFTRGGRRGDTRDDIQKLDILERVRLLPGQRSSTFFEKRILAKSQAYLVGLTKLMYELLEEETTVTEDKDFLRRLLEALKQPLNRMNLPRLISQFTHDAQKKGSSSEDVFLAELPLY